MSRKLGVPYMISSDRRQMRIGKPKEPVTVVRLYKGAAVNDEVVITERLLDFALFGIAVNDGPECQRAFLAWQQARRRARRTV